MLSMPTVPKRSPLKMVRQGRSIVIQGPPGTGKSQSITNLIATAVLDGKKVLFVAEKLAALEVVKRRLDSIGLGALCLELHSQKSNKRAVLEEIRNTWTLGRPRGQELESIVNRLEATRQRLNQHALMMHTRLEPSGATPFRIMGALSELGERGKEQGEFHLPEAASWDKESVRERRALLNEMAQRIAQMGLPCEHPWRGVEREMILNIDLPRIGSAVENLDAALLPLREAARHLAEILQQAEPPDFLAIESLRRMAAHIAEAPPLDREALCNDVWNGELNELSELVHEGRAFDELRRKITDGITAPAIAAAVRTEFEATLAKINRLISALAALLATSKQVAQLLQQPEPAEFRHTEILRRVVTHLAMVPTLDSKTITQPVWDEDLPGVRRLIDHGVAFAQLQTKLSLIVTDSALETDFTSTRANIAAHGESLFRFFNGEFRRSMAALRGVLHQKLPTTHAETLALLDELVSAHHHLLKLREGAEIGRQAFGTSWRDEESDWKQLSAVVSWIESEAKAGVKPEIRKIFAAINSLEEFNTLNRELSDRFSEAWQAVEAVKEEPALDFVYEDGTKEILNVEFSILKYRLIQWRDWLNHLLEIQKDTLDWKALSVLASWIVGADDKSFNSSLCTREPVSAVANSIHADLQAAQSCYVSLSQKSERGRQTFGSTWHDENSDWEQLDSIIQWVQSKEGAYQNAEFRRIFSALGQNQTINESGTKLGERMKTAWQEATALKNEVKMNVSVAFGSERLEQVSLANIEQKLTLWRDKLEDLTHWNTWFLRARRARELELGPLVEALEAGHIPASVALDVFGRAYYSQLLRKAVSAFPELARFDGMTHQRLIDEFRQADRDRIQLAKYRVLSAHFSQMPARNAGIGATGFLLGEMERKRGHSPVRKLLKNAGSVVQAIKPVFMMSPLSIAQFLEPGAVEFDLLVIDEASQVQPVDALGAFARAKQHVVVGDSKQLPPTRFFARLTSSDDEGEIADDELPTMQAKDVESILGLCLAKGLKDTMLRWHYRSRHHSLIAVSNREFYDDKLFIVPSSHLASTELGLHFHYVKGGIYDRGGSSTNRVEANAVCRAVMEHARRYPGLSLGVAAFSVKQQQAILDELELLRRENSDTEEFFQAHPYEPFFVKNLENVQGDERDVIFISVGYGPNASGFITMNFGPLNNDGGERRLNVLISRSKRRCEVFASLHAADIDLARAGKPGVRAFKTFLQYAETGVLGVAENTGREEDSPFEIAVRRAVESLGYEVHPQVGVAGFFIDLAVVDPAKPGRYLLGIECDGATYHSSRSARDRDRLRQAVLEDHGWIIHRIWSTDWFQRPNEQIRQVAAALEKAKIALAELPEIPEPALTNDTPDIQRDAQTAPENTAPVLAVPYEEANFDVPYSSAPHELSSRQMAEVLLKIIQIESPIHEDELIARVRDLWHLGRAGSRIQNSVRGGVAQLLSSKRCQINDTSLFLPDMPIRVRSREDVSSAGLRKPEFLPPQEICAAIESVLTNCHSAARDELVVAVARLFGFKSTSTDLRKVIKRQIEVLEKQQRLVEQEGFLKINEDVKK